LTTIACLIASSTWRACIEQSRGIDLSHLGISGRMVEKPGQAAQKLTENADRHFVRGDGHSRDLLRVAREIPTCPILAAN
jgi:hypothetical protein